MRAARLWQGVVAVILTVMITLNLRLLLTSSPTEEAKGISLDDLKEYSESKSLCEKPVIISIDNKAQVAPLNASFAQLKWLTLEEGQAKVVGVQRKEKGFLTVGVPSIKRINGMTYLVETITSLVDKTSHADKLEVTVVVFLADADTEYNSHVLQTLTDKFMDYINMGFLHIVQVPSHFYPPLTGLKRNFNDKPERVAWRAKQTVDFAFLFLYSRNLSQYYIQIEDDVVAASNFVTSVREYIKALDRTQWAVLDFSELGFIGKLFRSDNLEKLARYMLTFYDEQPVDWLIAYFRLSMAQKKVLMRKPTIFQHIGLKSSFDVSKDNRLKDRFFDSGEKPWKADDPPATVISNMEPYDQWLPTLAYGSGSGYFWASKVKVGDWLALVFEDPVTLQRVVVETGDPKTRKDTLLNGTVEVSSKVVQLDEARNEVLCDNLRKIGDFENGRVDLANLDNRLNHGRTKCLRMTVGVGQSQWVIFQQVAVFVAR